MADEIKPHTDMKEEARKIQSSPNTVASLKEAKKIEETALQKPEAEKPVEVQEKVEEKKPEVPKEEKKIKKETPKIKKTKVSAKGRSVPISTKDAKFVCKFIKNKRIGDAIRDLEQVEAGKKAVPMKGEIPHRKGKGIASGRFPKKAAKHFVILLKSLAANANEGNLDEPIITEAIANMAERPYGRFGTQKKRTHIKIIAKDKINKEKKQ